jgi:RimJ/RimL family protein N-acetyltransferase
VVCINSVCAEGIYLLTSHYVPTPQWEAVLHRPEEAPGCVLLVPVLEGRVIGWCRVFAGANAKTRHAGDVGIGLLAPYREQGIGTALMERAIAWAAGQGLAKLTADTFATNARARALLRRAGFVETGVLRRQYRIDGHDVDQILLERFL